MKQLWDSAHIARCKKEATVRTLRKALSHGYWIGLLILVTVCFYNKTAGGKTWNSIFHLAYYVPPIGLLALISGELDLLSSIERGGVINMRARCMNFIHWFLLIFLNIGAWMTGGVNISWFVLKVVLVAIIGWQIGVGLNKRWRLTANERFAGTMALILATLLGLGAGMLRAADQSPRGWGWLLETITACGSTAVVMAWILTDIKTIRGKAADYPRSNFRKGIFSNSLIVWFWLHIAMPNDGLSKEAIIDNLGLTINVIIGNLIYLTYYAIYEFHRLRQTAK